MANTDYKFWYILREDDIHISEVGVRFYEGDVSTKDEFDPRSNKIGPITRYRRTRRLNKVDLNFLKSKKFIQELNGNDSVVYTSQDFGVISSDDELRVFLNNELKKDKLRTPIDEQNTLDISKVK